MAQTPRDLLALMAQSGLSPPPAYGVPPLCGVWYAKATLWENSVRDMRRAWPRRLCDVSTRHVFPLTLEPTLESTLLVQGDMAREPTVYREQVLYVPRLHTHSLDTGGRSDDRGGDCDAGRMPVRACFACPDPGIPLWAPSESRATCDGSTRLPRGDLPKRHLPYTVVSLHAIRYGPLRSSPSLCFSSVPPPLKTRAVS